MHAVASPTNWPPPETLYWCYERNGWVLAGRRGTRNRWIFVFGKTMGEVWTKWIWVSTH